eukprot:g44147.t1
MLHGLHGILGQSEGRWGMLPDQHFLVLVHSNPGKPLLPRPRIPYNKMLSLLPTTRVHLHHPGNCLHVDVKKALDEIYTTTNALKTKFPKALFIVAGNFNLMQVMPKYHQHISCPTRGPNILDHCYTTSKDATAPSPAPYFGKLDHSAVFLLPAYKQKLKWENPSQNEDYRADLLERDDWWWFNLRITTCQGRDKIETFIVTS